MIELANRSDCTGCEACIAGCPVGAIQMKLENGFWYPIISPEKCIQCHKCEKSCPIINPLSVQEHHPRKVYAALHANEKTRKASSSGGAFSALAEETLSNGGIVFGARFDDEFNIIHDWIDCESNLYLLRTSKYVQSRIGNAYAECKQFLQQGRKVLFSGTACQIAGLYRYLGKDNDNLTTVDLICAGATSPDIWQKYKKMMEKKYNSKIKWMNFRSKKYGWDMFSISFRFGSGKEYTKILPNDPWAYLFLHHHIIREACFSCPYKDANRSADFTLGDFWGVQMPYPELYDDKGLSFVILNNEKAQKIWRNLNDIKSKEVSISIVHQYNTTYQKLGIKPVEYEQFWTDAQEKTIQQLFKKYVHITKWKKCNLLQWTYYKVHFLGGSILRRIRKIFSTERGLL